MGEKSANVETTFWGGLLIVLFHIIVIVLFLSGITMTALPSFDNLLL